MVSAELKEILQRDYDKIKRAKQVQENKKQRVQSEIEMNYRLNPFSSFSPIMSTAGSSHQQIETSGTPTLNTLWKPLQKKEVDDALADMFFEYAIPFNVLRSPYFINA